MAKLEEIDMWIIKVVDIILFKWNIHTTFLPIQKFWWRLVGKDIDLYTIKIKITHLYCS